MEIKLYEGIIVDNDTIELEFNLNTEKGDFIFENLKVKKAKDINGNDLYADELTEIETFYKKEIQDLATEKIIKKYYNQ